MTISKVKTSVLFPIGTSGLASCQVAESHFTFQHQVALPPFFYDARASSKSGTVKSRVSYRQHTCLMLRSQPR